MTKFEDFDWEELPDEAKEAAEALGYTEDMWDEDEEPDEVDKYWKELTKEQQEAAKVLGYDETSWNSS
eukprot:CAMPEP_0178912966 /NCGR_PEP_ID=MMETSP0786-20121207/10572_1 /TAXON_ID=186022 /ORGANISM="Thalassionema frauenfeldii, Strain CCMP 1798" /LENGTH=67 /DNA_ID=CAMNT_0020585639 /DNA_START=58 /DNA_END=261 /DNA_ORIENTATION=+